MLPHRLPDLQQHNTIIISQKNPLVNRKLYQSHNFYDVYKKILLSFYKLPIVIPKFLCYNKDTKEVRSNVQVSPNNLFFRRYGPMY